MSFRKYDSIENHYRDAYITRARDTSPKIENSKYVVQEKIHGANISILFTPHEHIELFSRNNKLPVEDGGFSGIWTVLEEDYIYFLESVQDHCESHNLVIRLYGEFFGSNIQKGVDYGKEKRVRFYDMMIGLPNVDNQIYTTQKAFKDFMVKVRYEHLMVPVVCYTENLETALLLNVKLNSHLGPDGLDENIMEGVVIKPYDEVLLDHYGRMFYIKMKNNEFLEKVKAKKRKEYTPEDPKITGLKAEFESYLTDMRMQSVFSKMGPIEEMSQIGEYIRAFHTDAVEDFRKDFGEEFDELRDNEKKKVLGITSKFAVPMLKAAM